MAELIRARSLTDAWFGGLQALQLAPGRELYDLIVEASEPSDVSDEVIAFADAYFTRSRLQSSSTVANTIFPAGLAARSRDRATLYARYGRMLPRLKKRRPNSKGIYFERLINFPLQSDASRSNQLELVIDDLNRRSPTGAKRHIYEMQIFAPGQDRWPMGFPCMSSLSLHLQDGALRLAATYRNQYWIERGLGNLIGLSHLQQYVAGQTGLPVGALSMHAFHAEPHRSQRDTKTLLDGARRLGAGTPQEDDADAAAA